MVSTPRRMSSLHAAVPMKPAPPMTRALVNISRDEVDVDVALFPEASGKLGREHDGAMPATGTSEGDHEVHAPLLFVQGQQFAHHTGQVVEQPARRRLAQNEVGDGWVATREVAELWHP